MTEDDIIDRLVIECRLNRFEAKDLLQTFLSHIKDKINEGERVKLPGLGTLFLKTQKYQRKKRDIPVTEDTRPWCTVSFAPAPAIKARVQRALILQKRIEATDRELTAEYLESQQVSSGNLES